MEDRKMAVRTKVALGVAAGVWILAVLAAFVLAAAAEGVSLWQAFGAACIIGALFGIIGGAVIISNWRELQLP